MQGSVCLGAILIPEYLDSILAILLPGAEWPEYIPEYILIPEYSQTNAPLVLPINYYNLFQYTAW